MIIWINGTYGVGKTTVAQEVKNILGDCAIIIEPDIDFQRFCKEKFSKVGGGFFPQNNVTFISELQDKIENKEKENKFVIVPMTVAMDESKIGLIDYFKEKKIIKHFILTASNDIIRQRIDNDYNRDKELSLRSIKSNINYFKNNFHDDINIFTDNLDKIEVANRIVEVIHQL